MSALYDSQPLTLAEAARLVHVRRRVFKEAVDAGRVPVATVRDGKRLFRADDVHAWYVANYGLVVGVDGVPRPSPVPPPRPTGQRDPVPSFRGPGREPDERRADERSEPDERRGGDPTGRWSDTDDQDDQDDDDEYDREPLGPYGLPVDPREIATPPPDPRVIEESHGSIVDLMFETDVPVVTQERVAVALPTLIRNGVLKCHVLWRDADGQCSDAGHVEVTAEQVLVPERLIRHGGLFRIVVYSRGQHDLRTQFFVELDGELPPPDWKLGAGRLRETIPWWDPRPPRP